jgi:hypothetical protein
VLVDDLEVERSERARRNAEQDELEEVEHDVDRGGFPRERGLG